MPTRPGQRFRRWRRYLRITVRELVSLGAPPDVVEERMNSHVNRRSPTSNASMVQDIIQSRFSGGFVVVEPLTLM
jgi:hypothetical protein